jgi:hypothetical protein
MVFYQHSTWYHFINIIVLKFIAKNILNFLVFYCHKIERLDNIPGYMGGLCPWYGYELGGMPGLGG